MFEYLRVRVLAIAITCSHFNTNTLIPLSLIHISTSTEFYWSTDTVLDNSDIALGSQAEISMSDTTFLERFFIYTKPTTAAGTYYILHKVDASNQVNEMREYDNIGYFKLHQDVLVDLPYSNDFETQVDGWYHEATLGSDEWSWGEPSGGAYEAFSGTKAWLTNDTGLVSQDSRMHLYTPVFDFTSIEDVYKRQQISSATEAIWGIRLLK